MATGLIPEIKKDYEDHYCKTLAIERSDMTIDSTSRIASRFEDESGNVKWIEEEIGKNAVGETIYIKFLAEHSTRPSWVPSAAE